MKKISKILLIGLPLIIVTFSGCEEKVLDKDPITTFTDNDVWSDITLAEKFLTVLYGGLGSWGLPATTFASGWLFSQTDDGIAKENWQDALIYPMGQVSPENLALFRNFWSYKYGYIRRCNIFLDRIDQLKGELVTQEDINIMNGQAKYIRASIYHDLIKFWGGVPLITKVFLLDDDFSVHRNNYEEIIDWIVKELDEAKELVPEEWPSSDWGRVDRGACIALKSRVLLYANSKLHDPETNPNGPLFDYTKNTWQEVANSAKEVIDMPQYALQQVDNWKDYNEMFFNRNPEMIFVKNFHKDYGSRGRHVESVVNYPRNAGGWNMVKARKDLVEAFQMKNGKNIDEPDSGYDSSPESIYENREMRFYANIFYQGSEFRGVPLDFVHPDGEELQAGEGTVHPGYQVRKFIDESIDIRRETGDMPWIWIRLAEIYLTYAEAQYELGNESEARKYVNLIRNRVHLPDINSTGEELFEDIQHERRIELVFENHRFYDVRRWMILDVVDSKDVRSTHWMRDNEGKLFYETRTIMERNFDEKFYYLPIPVDEINKSDLEQNPGYN